MKREELVSSGDSYAKKVANDLGLRDFYPGIYETKNGDKPLYGRFDGADFSVDIVSGASDGYDGEPEIYFAFYYPPYGPNGEENDLIENSFSFPVEGINDPKIDELLSVLLPDVTENYVRRYFRTFEGFSEIDERD